ncbi:MAG: hypothetical protein IJ574_03760 [Bacilli bacterium]|nr:hypothetical protein [Bacilli bacterium]
MEKKSGKGLLVVVGIVFCIIGLAGGYSLGKGIFTKNVDANKSNEQEKKEDNKDNNQELEQISVDSEMVKNAMLKYAFGDSSLGIDLYDKMYSGTFEYGDFTTSEIIALAINNAGDISYDYNEPSVLTIQQINSGLRKVENSSRQFTIEDIKKNAKYKELDEKIYGPNANYYHYFDYFTIEKFNTDSIELYGFFTDDPWAVDSLLKKVVKAEKSVNKLYIYEKVAYLENIDYENNIVSTYDGNTKSGNIIQKNIKDSELNWDLYSTYKWTFDIDNGNTYLESIIRQ